MQPFQNLRLLDFVRQAYTADGVRRLTLFLHEAGTFHFPALPSGLYPAAHVAHDDLSGYASVWVRDNAHVAYALSVDGRSDDAARTVAGLAQFFGTQLEKIAAVLAGRADASEPMNRPHIRFDGRTVAEIDVRWSHAQNDALGYFLWIAGRLIADGPLAATDDLCRSLAAVALFLERIEFWNDEDSGHWEETRKRNASSIGTATAGLALLAKLVERPPLRGRLHFAGEAVSAARLLRLVERGQAALAEHLPTDGPLFECIDDDPAKRRTADAALLFLVYPLEIVDGPTAKRIVEFVVQELSGEIGIRRYLGDSYWCADYKDRVAAEKRSADYSDDVSDRDALWRAGEEAQWCIFDPIVSAAYGRRYEQSGAADDLQRQTFFLNRSLAHLTADDSRFGGLRCPESYYLERGRYMPVDQTPLLWTQANLLVALKQLERNV